MKTLCIHHHNCADGFAAAVIIRRALRDNVEFHPGIYQTTPPDVTGRRVILVDFSYKRPALLAMAEQAKHILILDHHKSAAEDLAEPLPPNITAIFDMDRSGAMLAWNHFFPKQRPPLLIQHIQDRDLWRFAMDGTREIQAALFSYPYDLDTWDQLFDAPVEFLRDEGAAIDRKHQKDIRELITLAAHRVTIAGHDVPVLNAPYFHASDAGHLMAHGEPFAACYYDTGINRVYSLRSADNGLDVSAIAARFGGGGHKHAAGFRLPLDQLHQLAAGQISQESRACH